MNFFKKLFFSDDQEGVEKDEADSLSLDVKIEGQMPYTSSAAFITAYAKKSGERTGVVVSAQYTWYRVVDSIETKLDHTSNAYFFSSADLFAKIKVEVRPVESPNHDPSVVHFSTIMLDPRIKTDLYELASHSEGLMFALANLRSSQGKGPKLSNPTMYIFETYFKIVCQKAGVLETLRIGLSEAFKLKVLSHLYSGVRIEIEEFSKMQNFLEIPNANSIDLEFETGFDRDRAIIAIRLFCSLHNVRNEVVLAKILPLISPDNEVDSLKIADINTALHREILSIHRLRGQEIDKISNLEAEVGKLRSLLASNQMTGNHYVSTGMPGIGYKGLDKSQMLANSFMARESIAPEALYKLPQDIDMSYSQVMDT